MKKLKKVNKTDEAKRVAQQETVTTLKYINFKI